MLWLHRKVRTKPDSHCFVFYRFMQFILLKSSPTLHRVWMRRWTKLAPNFKPNHSINATNGDGQLPISLIQVQRLDEDNVIVSSNYLRPFYSSTSLPIQSRHRSATLQAFVLLFLTALLCHALSLNVEDKTQLTLSRESSKSHNTWVFSQCKRRWFAIFFVSYYK